MVALLSILISEHVSQAAFEPTKQTLQSREGNILFTHLHAVKRGYGNAELPSKLGIGHLAAPFAQKLTE